MLEETTMAEDVVLLRIHVMKEKETVMDPVTEVSMMDIKDVSQVWSVEVIIAENLVFTIMKKMIAVKNPPQPLLILL